MHICVFDSIKIYRLINNATIVKIDIMLLLFLVYFILAILIVLVVIYFIYMNKIQFNFSINIHSDLKDKYVGKDKYKEQNSNKINNSNLDGQQLKEIEENWNFCFESLKMCQGHSILLLSNWTKKR